MRRTASRGVMSVAVAGVLSLFLAGGMRAQSTGNDLVRVRAKGSVSQVAGRIKKAASDQGLMVLGHINQGNILSITGASVESRSFFLGSPHVGKQLFSADDGVGAVVPPRVNVYRDANGQTYIGYVKPSAELRAFDNQKIDHIAQMLDKKLRAVAREAAS